MKEKEKLSGDIFGDEPEKNKAETDQKMKMAKELLGMLGKLDPSRLSGAGRDELKEMLQKMRSVMKAEDAFAKAMCLSALHSLHPEGLTGDLESYVSTHTMLTESESQKLHTTANMLTFNYMFGPWGHLLMHVRMCDSIVCGNVFQLRGMYSAPDDLLDRAALISNIINVRIRRGRWCCDPATGVFYLELDLFMTGSPTDDELALRIAEASGRAWFISYLPHLQAALHDPDMQHALWRLSYVDLNKNVPDFEKPYLSPCEEMAMRQERWHNLYDDSDIERKDHSSIVLTRKEDDHGQE